MRIANNTAAFNTWTNYTNNLNNMQLSTKRLSTGSISDTDDPAGIGIAERMRSQLDGSTKDMRNTGNSISLLQKADSWLEKVNDMVSKIKSLTVETQGEGINRDKENVQAEFKQMQDEISRITSQYTASAKFSGIELLKSENGAETNNGNGANDASADVTQTNNTNTSTTNSTGKIEAAVNYISNARESFQAQQVSHASTREALMTYEDNIRASESKIRDIDMARESSPIAKYQMMANTSNAMLSQANQLSGSILRLIG